MAGVHGISVYLGRSPAAKQAAPAPTLMPDAGAMCEQFRRLLLGLSDWGGRFEATVNIPELPPLDVRWTG